MEEGFPKTLSTGVVHAHFKGGNASKFDKYKGIMVGPILAKLFAHHKVGTPLYWCYLNTFTIFLQDVQGLVLYSCKIGIEIIQIAWT
jgi:hypothetical protein